jgi:hypothetical protein
MGIARLAVGILLISGSHRAAVGDLLVRKIPAEGNWATFHCTEEFDEGTKRTLRLTIIAGEKTSVDGQDCQWIDLKYQAAEDGSRERGAGFKVLIACKLDGPNADPLGSAVKVWRTPDGQAPVELDLDKFRTFFPRLHLVISPAIDNLKKTDQTETVEWQGGRLTCGVFEGTARREYPVETSEDECRLFLNDAVPFGVAGCTLRMKSSLGYRGTIQYRLTDMGTEAKSDLSNVK